MPSRPRDLNSLAKSIVDEATDEDQERVDLERLTSQDDSDVVDLLAVFRRVYMNWDKSSGGGIYALKSSMTVPENS